MDANLWTGIGQLAVFVGVGVTSGYAAWKARRADQQTRQTGNGWAEDVKQSLGRIEGKIDQHLQDHAATGIGRPRRGGRP